MPTIEVIEDGDDVPEEQGDWGDMPLPPGVKVAGDAAGEETIDMPRTGNTGEPQLLPTRRPPPRGLFSADEELEVRPTNYQTINSFITYQTS